MPSMSNITVKMANGTTDYVLTALQGAGPDGTQALWRNDTGPGASLLPEQRLTAAISTRWNDKRNARVAQTLIRLPVTEDTPVAGVKRIIGYAECRDGRWVIPQGTTQANIDDFVAIAANFQASALIKASIGTGFAPST